MSIEQLQQAWCAAARQEHDAPDVRSMMRALGQRMDVEWEWMANGYPIEEGRSPGSPMYDILRIPQIANQCPDLRYMTNRSGWS